MSVATPSRTRPAARLGSKPAVADLAALTKPGITRLVVLTTAAGFLMASAIAVDLVLLLHTVFGAGLAAAGANALNMWWERGPDASMRRTAQRPLPAGRLSPGLALAFALGISFAGLLHLAVFVNLPTLLLVGASLGSYVLVYTPLKRVSHHATLIGAVPGALPILAGWTAAGTSVGATAVALFGVVFFWQMPHFYALAWVYREDYGRGGMRMLSVVDGTGARLARQSVGYSAALLVASLVPVWAGAAGAVYGAGAVVFGLVMVALSLRLWSRRDDRRAWQLFFGSITYLPALLTLLLVDRYLL